MLEFDADELDEFINPVLNTLVVYPLADALGGDEISLFKCGHIL